MKSAKHMPITYNMGSLVFVQMDGSTAPESIHKVFNTFYRGDILVGTLQWRKAFSIYMFTPSQGLTLDLDEECLNDIARFLNWLNTLAISPPVTSKE